MATERLQIVISERGARQVKRQIAGIGAAARKAKGGVSLLRTALGGLGAFFILRGAIRTIADFSQTMSTLRAVTGAAGKEFEALEAKALRMGLTTRFTARQAGEAMVFLARTGFDTNEVLATIEGTLRLAVIGLIDIAKAADIASNVLKGFRLGVSQMGRVVDVLAKTSVRANVTIESLGDAMSFAAPAAATLGVEIETAAAAVGVLGDAGIPASRAGAGLNTVMTKLSVLTPKARRALIDLGLSIDDVSIEARGFVPVMEALAKANIGVEEAAALVGFRQGKLLLVMAASIKRLKELEQGNIDAKGTSKELADEMENNLKGSILRLSAAWEGLNLAIGKSGAEGFIRNVVDRLASGLILLSKEAGILTDVLAVLAGVIVVRLVQGAIALLIPAIVAIGTAVAALSTTVLPLLAGAAIGAFGAMAIIAVREGKTITEVFNEFSNAIGIAFDKLVEPTQALAEFNDRLEDIVLTIHNVGGVANLAVPALLDLREEVQALIDDMQATLDIQNFLAPHSAAAKQLKGDMENLKGVLASITETIVPTVDPEVKGKKGGKDPKTTPQFEQILKDLQNENDLLAFNSREREVQAVLLQAQISLTKDLTKEQAEEIRTLIEGTRVLQMQSDVIDGILAPTEKYIDTLAALESAQVRAALSAEQLRVATRDNRIEFLNTQTTFEAGIERAFLKMAKDAEDNAGRIERAITGAFDKAGDALAEFVETGKFDFSSLIQSIQSDLIKLSIKGAITGPLGKLLSGESLDPKGSGTFGGFGGLLGDIFGEDTDTGNEGGLEGAGAILGAGGDAAAGATLTAAGTTLTVAGTGLTVAGTGLTTAGATMGTAGATLATAGATLGTSGATLATGGASLITAGASLNVAAGALSAAAATSGGAGAGSIFSEILGGGVSGSGGIVPGGDFDAGGGGIVDSFIDSVFGGGAGFRHGGKFIVGGGSGGIDQTNVGFQATRGEEVTVRTKEQQMAGGQVINQTWNITSPDVGGFNRNAGQILGQAGAGIARSRAKG